MPESVPKSVQESGFCVWIEHITQWARIRAKIRAKIRATLCGRIRAGIRDARGGSERVKGGR